MATRKAIRKIRTKKNAKKVYKRTPTGKPSRAKSTSDFYGSPIRKGALHKALGVSRSKKIPVSTLRAQLAKLKKKKTKTAADVKKERELVYALNAKTKWKK